MEEDVEIENSYHAIIKLEFFSKNDILSISNICSSLQNTKISMYARSTVSYRHLSKAAVCFFRVKSIVGRYFTTYEEQYNEIFPHDAYACFVQNFHL